MIKKILLVCIAGILIGTGIFGFYLCPVFKALPKSTGPFKVGLQAVQLIDHGRIDPLASKPNENRALMVHIFYPVAPNFAAAEPAPYLQDKMPYLQNMLATRFHIPLWVVRLLLSNIKTNSYRNAPVLQEQVPYPAILFSHGLCGFPSDMYLSLLENLASHGYIVIAIDHTYLNELTLFPDGKIVTLSSLCAAFSTLSPQEQQKFQSSAIDVYKSDIQFVMDQLALLDEDASSSLYHYCDLDHIGVMGHSAGGTAAIELCRIEDRCKAAANLDGWYDHVIGHELLHKPLLLMFGSESIDVTEPTPEYLKRKGLTRDQNFEREQNSAKHRQALCNDAQCTMMVIPGASHGDFGDEALMKWPFRAWSAPDSYETLKSINRGVLNFFNQYLR
jgi:dienelactone hydrolase